MTKKKLTQKEWERFQLFIIMSVLRVGALVAILWQWFGTGGKPNPVTITTAAGFLGLPSVINLANRIGKEEEEQA